MDLESLRAIAISLPGVTEDIKWEHHLCFNVGGKMFLITSPDEVPVNASFKVTDEDFERLRGKRGILPAPYLARYKWIKVCDIGLLSKTEWQIRIQCSYELVASKLPKTKL